jgi:hypothetical protein
MSTSEQQKHETPNRNKDYSIVVNARPVTVTQHKLSYLEVAKLAFPDAAIDDRTIYTITYSKGEDKHEGEMAVGDTVTVKDGMIFSVTRTYKS